MAQCRPTTQYGKPEVMHTKGYARWLQITIPLQWNFMELYVWEKFSQTLLNCGCSYPRNCTAKFSFSGRTYSSPPIRDSEFTLLGVATEDASVLLRTLRRSLLLFTALYKCIYTYSTVTRDLGVLTDAQLTHSTGVIVRSPAAVSTYGVSKK